MEPIRSIRFAKVMALGLAIAALAAASEVRAQPLTVLPGNGCDLPRTQGRYGYLLTGHIMNFGDPEFYAAGGVLTLNDDGTFSMTGTQMNFQQRAVPKGPYDSNVHVDVEP